MASYLFFDDHRLLVREGLHRVLGTPILLRDTLYTQAGGQVSGAQCRVWKENDHSYHMFYQAFQNGQGNNICVLAAHSEDGLHFVPRNTAREAGIENPAYENQVIPGTHAELFTLVDTGKSPGRLKMLVSRYGDLTVTSEIYESDDGIHWMLSSHRWHENGTEPVGSVVYSRQYGKYILLCRPYWGVRRVCESRTEDFAHFTRPDPVLTVDALDKPLSEIYGLYGFAYKDLYVGILTMYETKPSNIWKYMGGYIRGQLAYSFDGAHWQRCLRSDFMPTDAPFSGMIFASEMRRDECGNVLLYAGGTSQEHGYFHNEGSAIGVFRLREDGFAGLQTDGTGRMRTRETLINGAFDINIQAERATCALYASDDASRGEKAIPGFGHEDCEPFSGDCTHWTPEFKGDVSDLVGRVITIEVKLEKGVLWGINGDFEKMMNTEAMRYASFGERTRLFFD